MVLRPRGTRSRPGERQRETLHVLFDPFLCVFRRCVQLWCCLMCCRPWRWCSAGQMLCAPPGTRPSPPPISWPSVLVRGYRWSSCTRTNSRVSNYELPPPPQAAMVLSSCMAHMQSTVITVMDLPLNFQLTLTALGLHLMFTWMIVKAEAKTNRSPAKTLATSPLDASCRRHSFISGQC